MNGKLYYEQRAMMIDKLKAAGVEHPGKIFKLITDKNDMIQCNRNRSIQIQDMRDMLRDVKAA